jgi:outer membrane protein TolC
MEVRRHFWPAFGLLILLPLCAVAQEPAKDRKPEAEMKTRPPSEPSLPSFDGAVKPIDLASALRLAGVRNAEIQIARERIVESLALRQFAAAQWLPNLNAGGNFDHHNGPLQQSNGVILKVNRDALYVGMGAGAIGGGTVTIPGVVWSGNVSDVIFRHLVSKQLVNQAAFNRDAVQNDVLLRVANTYMELLRAEGRRAIARRNRDEAQELARITANYAKAGLGRQADANRAATELEQRETDLLQAEQDTALASARLSQLLSLDPSTRLQPTDGWVVPQSLVPDPIPLPELLAIALTQRPEMKERQTAVQAALLEMKAAKLLPFSPNVLLGYSTGAFGGGGNLAADAGRPRFGDFNDRQDFDAVLVWSLRNLGVGNVAQVRFAESRVRSNQWREIEMLDRVRAEVASAHARTHLRFRQIETGEKAVASSTKAFTEDLLRTKNREGLPIEVLDSLRLLARSRQAYLDAIIDYNRAQFELYVSLGQPPADVLARPVPANLVPNPTEAPAIPAPKK